MIQLPMIIVNEFLDGLPFWTAEPNRRIPKIDETGYFDILGDPEDLLDLRLSTGGG